jgi:hypothetical protein
MQDIEVWYYVFAEKYLLWDAGVKSATPVCYDPITGVIAILNVSAECNEWVVCNSGTRGDWVNLLKQRYGVVPIQMKSNMLQDLDVGKVQLNPIGQRLMFTDAMTRDYERLMSILV